MEDELNKMTNDELLETYTKTTDFIEYLEKQYKNSEKMRDSNE